MVGRKPQLEQIELLKKSGKSEFVAIMGRRRVGKTYLIDNAFADNICFQMSGIQMGSTKVQLENFQRKLLGYNKKKKGLAAPKDWGEAFFQLQEYLDTLSKKKKQAIFLDELPWMATARTIFLQHLAHFWNDYLSKQKHFILIICGSASSWLVKQVTNDKGGLHNRITSVIKLEPFSLLETSLFLATKNIKLGLQDIAKIYMAMGGIPYYLDDIRKGESAAQAIERMCFEPEGKLNIEYDNLYKALFKNAHTHERIVTAVAGSQKGMLRSEIILKSKIQDGGPFNRAMQELIDCGFIITINQFGQKKRDEVYRLHDEYTAFYHRFIKPNKKFTKGIWLQIASSQSYKTWLGFAFELLAYRHLPQIKNKLSIAGIYSEVSTHYYNIGKQGGLQVDLLINRKDNTINYCEMKYYEDAFTFTKTFSDGVKEKMTRFKSISKTRKQLFLTMITNYPIKENEYSLELMQNNIVLEDLFEF
jgi:uncharacterized protein